jgi:hypothetical protein
MEKIFIDILASSGCLDKLIKESGRAEIFEQMSSSSGFRGKPRPELAN